MSAPRLWLTCADTWPTLEYETPKDVLNHLAFFQNQAVLRRFRSRRPFPFRGTPTPDEEALASAAFTLGPVMALSANSRAAVVSISASAERAANCRIKGQRWRGLRNG